MFQCMRMPQSLNDFSLRLPVRAGCRRDYMLNLTMLTVGACHSYSQILLLSRPRRKLKKSHPMMIHLIIIIKRTCVCSVHAQNNYAFR